MHLENSRIPCFLRIDKDVIENRRKLADLHDQYMNFNIRDFEEEILSLFRNRIEEVSKDFSAHKALTDQRLVEGENINKNSLNLQNNTVSMRIEQNKNISSAMQESQQSLNKIDDQLQQLDKHRRELQQQNDTQRREQNIFRETQI